MAHSYRILQQWNHWLTHDHIGSALLHAEHDSLLKMLKGHFGKHAMMIGVPHQYALLEASELPCHTLMTPVIHHDKAKLTIESDLHQLPIMTGSIDLAILPHTLELIDHPRQLLTEACRIIKPEGLIIICGFNPLSLWGIQKFFNKISPEILRNQFISPAKIKNWLKLSDFELEKHQSTFIRPPLKNKNIFEKLKFMEKSARYLQKFGGVYILAARAKVVPLTPIKMQWKQQLGAIRIRPGLTGQIRAASK